MIRLAVLGSTGSIGTQTLDVVRHHPDRLRVVALAAGSNARGLREQAEEFGVGRLALCDEAAASDAGVRGGIQAVTDLAADAEVDLVVVAVAGVIGLLPTLAAIEAGKRIALASKEVLVAAGEVVMPLVRERGIALTPIDSEHSAIFQCMQGHRLDQIAELILTASGGPFRGWSRERLEGVSVEQALDHPTWRMGGKITVDSATLMNKGLETIEAHWLFDVPMDRIGNVVHPQSVIHSLVKFHDGSVLAQMGWPNMRLPIQYALFGPDRVPSGLPDWNPTDTPSLTFESIDDAVFPCPSLARESVRLGGTAPCAMNAANEEAANAFLRGEISFTAIPRVVEAVLGRHRPVAATLDHLLAADREARILARESYAHV